jgi:hypothetical protein
MAKLQLHFNGTFAFKKEEIKRILEAASQKEGLKDSLQNLMSKTGLGNAKVGKIKTWSIRAGLIKDNYLSAEGKTVLKQDPYLQSIITDWVIHFYLSFGNQGLNDIPENPADWGGWTYFIYDFLPQNLTFTKDDLDEKCLNIFEEKREEIPKRLNFILRTYTEDYALKSINFFKKVNSNNKNKIDQYETGNPNLPNTYLIGYFFAKLWERDFNKETSILTDDLIKQKMGLIQVLGINAEDLQTHLNNMESLGIIEQRRTVLPHQIIRRWHDPLTLLEKAYDNN